MDAFLSQNVNTDNLRKQLAETFDENGNTSMSKAEVFLFAMRTVLPVLLNEVDALRVIAADYSVQNESFVDRGKRLSARFLKRIVDSENPPEAAP